MQCVLVGHHVKLEIISFYKESSECVSITSGRTMALGSTQPLTEMSARGISWG